MPEAKRTIRAGLISLLLAALTGCHFTRPQDRAADPVAAHTVDSANWQQGNAVVEPQVEPITLVHTLVFAPGEARLDDGEIERLRSFLTASGVHDGARIEVDGPRLSGGYFDPLTKARLEDTRALLFEIGLRSQVPARPLALLAKAEDGIVVTVTRAMVIPPDCGAPQPEFAARPQFTWSCANAANLGYMVADPLDLVTGQTPGPADGEAATLAIKRYREGKTLTPQTQSTSSQ